MESQLCARRTSGFIMCLTIAACLCPTALVGQQADGGKLSSKSPEDRLPPPLSTAYLPKDAFFINMVRPRRIVQMPAMAAVRDAISRNPGYLQVLGVPIEEIDQMTTFAVDLGVVDPRGNRVTGGVRILDASKASVVAAAVKELKGTPVDAAPGERTPILKRPKDAGYYAVVNKTLILSSTNLDALRHAFEAGPKGTPPRLAVDWGSLSRNDVVWLGTDAMFPPPDVRGVPVAVSWIANEVKTIELALRVQDTLEARFTIQAKDGESAQRANQAFAPFVQVLRQGLSPSPDRDRSRMSPSDVILTEFSEPIGSMLASAKSEVQGSKLVAWTEHDVAPLVKRIAGLIPTADAVRDEEFATRDVRNVQKIAKAVEAYRREHDDNFPPAYAIGPDGKTTHSWRVALLPYLDEEALYAEYRLNEPWDSPNNRKLLKRIPSVYKSTLDPPESVNASYFVFVGLHAAFEGNQPVSVNLIYDGTSHTFLAVEAKRDIPWTKPEDIAFDENRNLPEFGGRRAEGFLAAFCDGTAELVPAYVPKENLRRFIVRDNDGRFPRLEKHEGDWRWEWQEKAKKSR